MADCECVIQVHCPLHEAAEQMRDALKMAIGAFVYQVDMCHQRQREFENVEMIARPVDWVEVAMNMYAATAEPLITARAALAAAEAK